MNGAWMQSYATDDVLMNVNLLTVLQRQRSAHALCLHGDHASWLSSSHTAHSYTLSAADIPSHGILGR